MVPASRRPVLAVAALFVLSLCVRLPVFDRPLSYHHEYNPAMFLVTLSIWEAEGGAKFRYAPVFTYPNEADRGVRNTPIDYDLTQVDGEYFYLSFPSLAYVVPFAWFRLLRMTPTPLGLQVFNVLVHFLCALLIFVVSRRLCGPTAGHQASEAAVLSSGAYLMAPGLLWYHGNAYGFDVLVLLFVLIAIVTLLPALEDVRKVTPQRLAVLGAALVAASLTEYVGYLLSLVVVGLASSLMRGQRRYVWLAVAASAAVLVAMALTFGQYAPIVGTQKYIEFLLLRFLQRSGHAAADLGSLGGFGRVITWYAAAFLPFLALLAFLLVRARTREDRIGKGPVVTGFLVLSVAPVLLHHLLLWEWTVRHDYSVIKTGIVLCGILGMLAAAAGNSQRGMSVVRRGFWLAVVASGVQFYLINPPGRTSARGLRYEYMREIGTAIRTGAHADEPVFLTGMVAYPQIVFYARRNIQEVESIEQARRILSARGFRKGYFVSARDGATVQSRRIESSGSGPSPPATDLPVR